MVTKFYPTVNFFQNDSDITNFAVVCLPYLIIPIYLIQSYELYFIMCPFIPLRRVVRTMIIVNDYVIMKENIYGEN